MRNRLIPLLLALATPALADDPAVLTVLTYDSLASEWGPGPVIEAGFEAVCGCDLRFITAGDGAALLARLRLEGARTDVDVVVGLDTALMAAAYDTGLFASLPREAHQLFSLPAAAWFDLGDSGGTPRAREIVAAFRPYDWGAFAFVYDSDVVADPPASFDELAASDLKVVIQDPRSSTPGLGLALWVDHAFGDRGPDVWAALAPRILTVTPGWTEAYGLFLEGEADMVLSYTTSPAYHAIAEADQSIQAAVFDEGHYLQVEVMGRLAGSDQPELGAAFLDHMLSAEVQAVLPTTNWMYPAILPSAGLPDGFPPPPEPGQSLLYPPDLAEARRAAAIDAWLTGLSR